MKLLRAEFENFRLLRDLKLDFSSDPQRNLTVLRAANESGKTSILHGLQWALYGDKALPGEGVGFRLHPIDWDESDGRRVSITVTVEFEVTSHRTVGDKLRENCHRYRLVRSAWEDTDTEKRFASTVKLFELTDTGANPIAAPEAMINDELPLELREVFFTDGDRALSFIEADVALAAKRERVEQAVRSLLGLSDIENAIHHVRKAATEVNKKAKQLGAGDELDTIASRLETVEYDCEKLESDFDEAKQQFGAFDEKFDEIDRKIAVVLQKGDKQQLSKDLEHTKDEMRQLGSQLMTANKDHSALFQSRSVAIDLLAPVLNRAFERLEELRDHGKIPNTTIPVLQERLSAAMCICGETLEPGGVGGDKRRAHIQKLIDDSHRADEIQETLTNLYYSAKPMETAGDVEARGWLEDYKRVAERRDRLDARRDEAGRQFRALESTLDSLSDADIQGLRETRRHYKEQRDRYLSQQSAIDTRLIGLRREREDLETKRDRLLREQKKGARVLAEGDVTRDVMKVLQGAYKRITNEELQKVSELMNRFFLEMIGADPEQGAIIQHAEISRDFDIIVYGPNQRTLNPDRDLNGASRRALTLAFILALTKVSEVEAPNVIDTPLGMTSGFVKRAILRTAVRESTQLILFLTHDEIAGCEDIINRAGGVVFTLTNPAHYPKMLVNDPGIEVRKVLRCACDHNSECQLCQRLPDPQVELHVAS